MRVQPVHWAVERHRRFAAVPSRANVSHCHSRLLRRDDRRQRAHRQQLRQLPHPAFRQQQKALAAQRDPRRRQRLIYALITSSKFNGLGPGAYQDFRFKHKFAILRSSAARADSDRPPWKRQPPVAASFSDTVTRRIALPARKRVLPTRKRGSHDRPYILPARIFMAIRRKCRIRLAYAPQNGAEARILGFDRCAAWPILT